MIRQDAFKKMMCCAAARDAAAQHLLRVAGELASFHAKGIRALQPGTAVGRVEMRIQFVVAITLLVSACDIFYGVQRRAALEKAPSIDCVHQAIKSAPGVTEVDFRNDLGGRSLTWSGLQEPDQVFTFFFRGSKESSIRGVLQVVRNYKGEVEFSNTLLAINVRPPQAQVDATRPVMRDIESALASQCGLARLPTQVRESCIGVECKN